MFDEEILLLRPLDGPLDRQTVEKELDQIPGSFRDPYEKDTWVLVVPAYDTRRTLAWRRENPKTYTLHTRVSLLPEDEIQVVPGLGPPEWGRAQKFVTWLLSLGPFHLKVKGKDIGRVTTPAEIYANTWPDPDVSEDPTESPPRIGRLTTLRREHGDAREEVAVHDAGHMAYTETKDIDGSTKTWRGRLTRALQDRWPALLAPLPLNSDEPGPGDEYTDPVYLLVETPTDFDEVKLDAAHLAPPYEEIVTLLDGWGKALRNDARTLDGIADLSPPEE